MTSRRRRRRLRRLNISEVSFVDQPANETPFLFAKNEEGIEGMEPEDIEKAKPVELDLNFSTKGTEAETAVVINGRTIKDLVGLHLDYYPRGEDSPVGLNVEYTTKNKGTDVGGFSAYHTRRLTKAEWSTKYVNDLPDSAFLWVESGGKKDSDGRTTPKSKRHLPVRNKAGNLDRQHVAAAAAAIAGARSGKPMDVPASAKAKLKAAQKELKMGAFKKADEKDVEDLTEIVGPVEAEMEAPLAKGLAEQARTVALYKEDLPPDLLDALRNTIKLATETVEDENSEGVEMRKSDDEPDKAQDTGDNAPKVDIEAIAAKTAELLKPTLGEAAKEAVQAFQEEQNQSSKTEDAATEKPEDKTEEAPPPETPPQKPEPPADNSAEGNDEELVEVDVDELAAEAMDEVLAEAADDASEDAA